jgi:hypothetical protein
MCGAVVNRVKHKKDFITLPRITRATFVVSLLGILAGAGCVPMTNLKHSKPLLSSGVIAISRPIPVASTMPSLKTVATSSQPTISDNRAESVVISRTDATITAFNTVGTPLIFRAEGAEGLSPGSFTITVKEEQPLWYAPNAYFQRRSLKVPQEGSRDRFRRAALGKHAVFLNNRIPIHSGPVWLEEIGGLKVRTSDMSALYAMLDVGTRVEIR